MKILLAEDDLRLGKMLKTILSKNGINVKWVTNGESAYDECYADGYAVLVLDWMMPGMSGIKLCSVLRSEDYQGKILMLTARDSLDDKVNGLNAGADDYLVKPFAVAELLARLNALVRRQGSYMEENVVVNHAGSVLMPEKLAMPKFGRLDVRDELGFLDEGNMTLREFCEAHQLPYPAENMKFHIRPARPEEAGLFYTPHPEEDKRLGTVGHVRMDFGRSGNEFWHTWWPRGPEELNSPVFKAELQEVVDTLRESVLKNHFAMERFCYARGGKISGGWTQNYGYIVETEHYRYCLRCNPSPGDYNGYLTAYDLDVQRQNMAREEASRMEMGGMA